MNITFADTFWKSLKRLSMEQTWWYKTYEVFRYKIPMFIKNIWYFKEELWRFRSWDYTFNLSIFARSLEKTAHNLEFYGHEVETTKMKKVEKMKRVIQIIRNFNESSYISMAESEFGELRNLGFSREDTPEEEKHNQKIFDRATELEKQEFEELWKLLKGQYIDEFKEIYDKLSDEEKMEYTHWENWFDGSGIKNWWD